MRIGEMAKKAGVTVRALQYYDKEGLLLPSAESEGGFRLYDEKDMARLIQILMMKQLGFSLGEIKKRLSPFDTPAEVISVLAGHAEDIRNKIAHLTDSLTAVEKLKEEISQTKSVNFQKYAGILHFLQKKFSDYWMIKHFDDKILEQVSEHIKPENQLLISEAVNRSYEKALRFHNAGVSPKSEKAQEFIAEFWKKLLELAGGDVELLKRLNQQAENTKDLGWSNDLAISRRFMDEAFEVYFQNKKSEEASDD